MFVSRALLPMNGGLEFGYTSFLPRKVAVVYAVPEAIISKAR